MTNILTSLQSLLLDAGFETRLAAMDRIPVLTFEDDVLMGFACVFEQASAMTMDWKATELQLLRRYAPSFRVAGDKAWNVYSVFLCSEPLPPAQKREVRWIEEDLEHTRKIAASGIQTREDLVQALLPVLPLQFQPVLQPEDMAQRLHKRVQAITPLAAEAVMGEVPPGDVARLLGEAS
jgi:hypothetical protein